MLVARGFQLLFVCGSYSGEFGASGEYGAVWREAVAVLGSSVRVGRVPLRADVLGADVAVVGRLVGESEIGIDVT